jgi:hypothetical protein
MSARNDESGLTSAVVALGVALGCLTVPRPSAAAEITKHFSVDQQLLATALNAFAAQCECQILFTADVVGGKRTQGVQGDLSPEAALVQLLSGTGLTYRVNSDNTILVQPAAADETSAIGEIIVTAQRRQQSIQAVGVSITAVSSEQIRQFGITGSKDIAQIAPGVVFEAGEGGGGIENGLTVRGISQSDFSPDHYRDPAEGARRGSDLQTQGDCRGCSIVASALAHRETDQRGRCRGSGRRRPVVRSMLGRGGAASARDDSAKGVSGDTYAGITMQ